MTPTRYPTWRSLAFAIAILELLSLVVMASRGGLRELPATRTLQASLLSQAVTLVGALTMRNRPALGFCIFGAGFLMMGAILLLLLPWERPLALPVTVLLVPGLLYTWLGLKQLESLRRAA